MVKQAEQFASEDSKKREEIETVNQADNLAYATEKSLKDYGDKVSPQERADIEARINELKGAIKNKNIEQIKKGMEELTKVSHKLAEEIYKQASAKQQQQSQQGPGRAEEPKAEGAGSNENQGGPDDVIDADFKPEDDKK
jgi:molecular chaperone DnaK